MYRKTNDGQLDIYDFILPFGGHLKADNRWVKLRQTINWELVEEEYGRNFANKDAGQEAYPADVAFGSLYIQRLLGFTDRELVDQIAENPYMQYFIGYKEYRNFCKQHSIRMSGPRLGRPGKKHADDLRQELKEIGERNAVEGKFGNGKRKLNLSLIMAKLKETPGTMIAMNVFILNMERLFRKGALFSCGFFEFVGETLLTGCFAVEWQT